MTDENLVNLIEKCVEDGNMCLPIMINNKFDYCGLYNGKTDFRCKYLANNDTSINGKQKVRLCNYNKKQTRRV